MNQPEPLSVKVIDTRHPKGLHRARWALAAGVIVAIAGMVAYLLITVVQQQRELSASCGFWSLIAGIDPVTATVPKPGRTLVLFIADARNSYIGQGCIPALPPPGRDLLHWAAVYHLTVRP